MKILLESKFPQFELMDAKKFLEYLKERGIHRSLNDLEFYDEIQVCKPILRLSGTLKDNYFKKCPSIINIQNASWYYEKDQIEFPHDYDFKPWKDWMDENNNPICMYYHPFQLLGFDYITSRLNVNIALKEFLQINDPVKSVEYIQKNKIKRIEMWQKAVRESWLPRIGFLLLLEESYAVHVRQEYFKGKNEDDTFEKWKDWKFGKFSPEDIMKLTPFTIENSEGLYNLLTTSGFRNDPLEHWFPLQKIFKRSRRQQLRGKALWSQDHYEMATMISRFIRDYAKKTVPEPDEIGNEGWKERVIWFPFRLQQ